MNRTNGGTKKSWANRFVSIPWEDPDLLSLSLVSPCSSPAQAATRWGQTTTIKEEATWAKMIQMELISPCLHLGLLLDKENVLENL
jgi:hypothetical protein